MMAASNEHHAIVTLLLSKGGDPNIGNNVSIINIKMY